MSSSQRRQTPTAAAAAALLGLLALLPSGVEAGFHLPGVAPKTYQTAENVCMCVRACVRGMSAGGLVGGLLRLALD